MAAAAKTNVIDGLRAEFDLDQIYSRQGPGGKALDYVSIETVLGRLLDVAPDYSLVGKVEFLQPGQAVVSVQLTVGDKTAFGIGEMSNPSTDMAVKSATSEAIKNAAKNGFGVALDLWNADYRDAVGAARKVSAMTDAQLKNGVFRMAKEQLAVDAPTAGDIAEHFGVSPDALMDPVELRKILIADAVAS